jgi:hypothetical protein
VDAADVLVWRAATREMNPSVPQAFIDREYAKDEASARSEYGAEWRDDITTFLDREQIEAMVDEDVTQRGVSSRYRYIAHCDPSGGRSDSMTLAIWHLEGDRVVLDCLVEKHPPFDPDVVVAELSDVLRQYGLRQTQIDSYGAEWVPSSFRRYNVVAHVAEFSTSDHYRALLPLVTTDALRLIQAPRLVNQLASLERRVAPSGRELISHPPGGHDDCAAALAGMAAQIARRPEHSFAFLNTNDFAAHLHL